MEATEKIFKYTFRKPDGGGYYVMFAPNIAKAVDKLAHYLSIPLFIYVADEAERKVEINNVKYNFTKETSNGR